MKRKKVGKMNRNRTVVNPNRMEEKKEKKQKKEEQEDTGEVCPVGGEGVLVCEIFSRLPTKSLMRFKCVNKRWQSIIQKDESFIDLHYSRSQRKSPSLLLVGTHRHTKNKRMLISAELQLRLVEEGGFLVGGGATCCEPKDRFPRKNIISTLNGLLCFCDAGRHKFCVYNCSTREETTWIRSVIKREEDEKRDLMRYRSCLTLLGHEFGYNSSTKEYKVVALWNLNSCYLGTGENSRNSLVCEVLNVRQNSWRRINVPSRITPRNLVTSIYVSDSIYWLYISSENERYYILKFNVASEKFSIIDTHSNFNPHNYYFGLMEVEGLLAIFYQCVSTNLVNMYTLYGGGRNDENKQNENTTTSAASTNRIVSRTGEYYWSAKEIFTLPVSIWRDSIRHIPRTDLFIMKSLDDDFSFYFYNWKTKSISGSQIEIRGLSSSLKGNNEKVPSCQFDYYVYTPNLLPVK